MQNHKSTAMLSRSVRLPKTLLEDLQRQADQKGIGITVHIREVLESHVSTEKLLLELIEAATENV